MSNFRWSFSAWATYNTCPAKYKFKYHDKLKEVTGPSALRGTQVHELVQSYIQNPALTADIFPSDVAGINDHIPVLNSIREHPNGERYTELMICLNKDWEWEPYPVKEKVFCTMILDAAKAGGTWKNKFKGQDDIIPSKDVVDIYEWKTGKPSDDHAEQRSLYALGGLKRWKQYETVRATTYYLDGTSQPSRLIAKRDAEERLQKKWFARAETMQSDSILAPRPGYYCRWCSFSKEKGGPCKIA